MLIQVEHGSKLFAERDADGVRTGGGLKRTTISGTALRLTPLRARRARALCRCTRRAAAAQLQARRQTGRLPANRVIIRSRRHTSRFSHGSIKTARMFAKSRDRDGLLAV